MNGTIVRHPHAVWGERADFEAIAAIDHGSGAVEMIPIESCDGRYIVCAVPFFVYGISLGDEVRIGDDARLEGAIKHANFFTYRISLDDDDKDQKADLESRASRLVADLESQGHLVEWWDLSYGAVAAESHEAAEALVAFLNEKEILGELSWEAAE